MALLVMSLPDGDEPTSPSGVHESGDNCGARWVDRDRYWPQHDGLWLIGWFGKLPSQQLGSIDFGKQLALEIQPGESSGGVAGSGIAVDAAMLAPLIGIDGATKRKIRRIVTS